MLESPDIIRILYTNINTQHMTFDDFKDYELHKDDNLFIHADPDQLDKTKEEMFFDYWHPYHNGWSWSMMYGDYDLEDGVYPFTLESDNQICSGYAFVYHGLINAQHLLSQLPVKKYGDHRFLEYMELNDGELSIHCGS